MIGKLKPRVFHIYDESKGEFKYLFKIRTRRLGVTNFQFDVQVYDVSNGDAGTWVK